MLLDQVQQIRIEDYSYTLPEERIARYPLPQRDASRLLRYSAGQIADAQFCDLPEYLPEGTVLVRNNSKVIRARILMHKPTGARIEVFCLEPLSPSSYELSLSSKQGCSWRCMLGNARRWAIGSALEQTIQRADRTDLVLRAQRIGQGEVHFSWSDESISFAELLELMGILPIPPYLNRETEERDLSTYQTVYAQKQGSVAAPTAGLHFTPEVEAKVRERGAEIIDLTLHVGAGTFRPVSAQQIGAHDMHHEYISLSLSTLERLRASLGRIIAVGTTSVRTLESLYWLGVRLLREGDLPTEALAIDQWLPYRDSVEVCAQEAFDALMAYMQSAQMDTLSFPTSILIAPGYRFRVVRGLITNFHQPHSTLLLLIAALLGEDWCRVYDHALQGGYRFLSYGDSSLLLP